VIRNRLCCKRVLIILDDVDQTEQLCALAEKRGWFGQGSRIIITTRNKRLLIEHNVAEDEIYEAKELNYYEALQLFCRKAFKEDRPPKEFVEKSKTVINYAGGLPIALEVLGSSLYRKELNYDKAFQVYPLKDFVELYKKVLDYAKGLPLALQVLGSSLYRRSVDVWGSMLSKVKEIPDEKIQDRLQISFDGLPEVEKKVFFRYCLFLQRGGQRSCGRYTRKL
jgi:hypothetical protein